MTMNRNSLKKSPFNADYVVVFFTSLVVIILELFLTRILNLKAWNHVVYTVIPFAILGYGIGANTYLIFKNKINQFSKKNVIGVNLFLIALFSIVTYFGLAYLPLRIEYVVNIFTNVKKQFGLFAWFPRPTLAWVVRIGGHISRFGPFFRPSAVNNCSWFLALLSC